jgi:hypothetical protein
MKLQKSYSFRHFVFRQKNAERTYETRKIVLPEGTFSGSQSVADGHVACLQFQVLLLEGCVQRPVDRGPAVVGELARVAAIKRTTIC